MPLRCRSESLVKFWTIVVIGMVFETWVLIEAMAEGFDLEHIALICGIPFILIFVWLIVGYKQYFLWKNWKKWAEEHGWQEEKA